MSLRSYARISGVIYFLLGIASLVPATYTRPLALPPLYLDISYGLFLGAFAQNIVNKVAIIGFGLAGMGAASSPIEIQRRYARAVFGVMGAAALLGAIPRTSTLFGLWPLWGNEAILHAVSAAIGGYFGFIHREAPVWRAQHV